jgi:glutathione S-transferase
VNWYLEEKNIPFTQKAPRPSPHPFGQTPCLTDDGGVEVFESGAILLYIADAYGGNVTPQQRASYTKWVMWANSELDGLCFGKNMSGTQLDKAGKGLDQLEKILSTSDWLVNNEFSVADVAVGAYLNYVPVFFGNYMYL